MTNLYTERNDIIDGRILCRIHALGGDIITIPSDANSLLYSYLYHIGDIVSNEKANAERTQLINFMLNHPIYQILMSNKENIKGYIASDKYLDERHVFALHEMNRINILLFEYQIETDQLSQTFYHQSTFTDKECLFLIYYKHSKHYNYCKMHNFVLPPASGYYDYIGDKYRELQILDARIPEIFIADDTRFCRLVNTLKTQRHELDRAETTTVLDDFLQMSDVHNSEKIFESIETCNINKCAAIQRSIRKQHFNEDTYSILDKIHCFYFHPQHHDAPRTEDADDNHNALTPKWTKMGHELENWIVHENEIGMYHFGHEFKYGYQGEYNSRDFICVVPKYMSLREELLNNHISTLTVCQFNAEHYKSEIHLRTDYRKKLFPAMQPQHLLALMVYCNFDHLQQGFSKTYRDNEAISHTEFYHLGKYLKMAVHELGTRIRDADIKTFYHGINKSLLFPNYINNGGVCIKCPLSTTSSFEVAQQFSHGMNGLVVEFNGSYGFDKYISVSWLSNYPNEFEYLFVQNAFPFVIDNITTVRSSLHEYDTILNAVRAMDQLWNNQNIDISHRMHCLIAKCIEHQLSESLSSYQPFKSLTPYGQHIIRTYFSNKMQIQINTKLQSFFFDDSSIDMRILMLLFPNLECIIVHHAMFSVHIILDMLQYLNASRIKRLKWMNIGKGNKSEISTIVSQQCLKTVTISFVNDLLQIECDHFAESQLKCCFEDSSNAIYAELYKYFYSNDVLSKLIVAIYEFIQSESHETHLDKQTEEQILMDIILCVLDHNLNELYFQKHRKLHFQSLLINECKISDALTTHIWNALSPKKILRPLSFGVFDTFEPRLIACNGDCGSKLSKLIHLCAHQKDIEDISAWRTIIADAFWCREFPARSSFVTWMEEKQIYKESAHYLQIYNQLKDENCFIKGERWSHEIIEFLCTLGKDKHIGILQQVANISCNIKTQSILHEINKERLRNVNKLRAELKVIESMIECNEYKNIKSALIKHKDKIQLELQWKSAQTQPLDKDFYSDKIRKIKKTEQFLVMKRKHMMLSNEEILSLYLYCDYGIFANALRKTQRKNQLNSCLWNKLFNHLCSALNKIWNALHYKNYDFYMRYIVNQRSDNLYHGCYNVRLPTNDMNVLPLHTLTSFSESIEIARNFAKDKGMILRINNAFELIYEGQIKAADVSWFSSHSCEQEWILLPTTLRCIHQTDDNACAIYEANMMEKALNRTY